jgi:hypothetical protein
MLRPFVQVLLHDEEGLLGHSGAGKCSSDIRGLRVWIKNADSRPLKIAYPRAMELLT